MYVCRDMFVGHCVCVHACVCSGNKLGEFVFMVIACGCSSLFLHNRIELHFLVHCFHCVQHAQCSFSDVNHIGG